MIGAQTDLTPSYQLSQTFSSSSSNNNDTEYIHKSIAALCVRQNIIYECCGIIGHKSDSRIINGPKFPPPSIMIKINQSNALNGDEPDEPPR